MKYMTYYNFILRFDDELHSLTAKNGLPIDVLADLLKHLTKAIQISAKESIVISEIVGNCYGITFTTPSLTIDNNLRLLHDRISQNKYNGFTKDQIDYARHLGKIMKERNLRINTYDTDKTFNYKLNEIVIPSMPQYYYESMSIYGIVTMIGGNNIDGKSSIKINSSKIDIEVNKQQENGLLEHFKKDRLRLSVQVKRHLETGEVKGATLESFVSVSDSDFFDLTKQIRDEQGDNIFTDII